MEKHADAVFFHVKADAGIGCFDPIGEIAFAISPRGTALRAVQKGDT